MTKVRSVSIAFLCLGATLLASAQAQQYVIANYAGGPPPAGANASMPGPDRLQAQSHGSGH